MEPIKNTRPFESKLMNPEILDMVNSVTMSNFNDVKKALIAYIRDNMKDIKHAKAFETKNSPRQLQKAVWDYILVSTGNKVIK